MNEKSWADALKPVKNISLDDRLFLVMRKIDKVSHIEVDQEKFKAHPDPQILWVCPSKVYEKNEETGECIVHFDNCLECGTCQVVNREFVIWNNPNSGFGVTYRFG